MIAWCRNFDHRELRSPPNEFATCIGQIVWLRFRTDVLERVKGIEPSSSAWKAVALPLSYTRAREALSPLPPKLGSFAATSRLASRSAAGAKAGGGGRTRTYEGVSQRIYRPLIAPKKPPFYRPLLNFMSRSCRGYDSFLRFNRLTPSADLRLMPTAHLPPQLAPPGRRRAETNARSGRASSRWSYAPAGSARPWP